MPLQQAPDPGAGEGISLQYVPDPGAPLRACSDTQPYRTPGQNLVPEPTNEDEEDDPREKY